MSLGEIHKIQRFSTEKLAKPYRKSEKPGLLVDFSREMCILIVEKYTNEALQESGSSPPKD